MVFYRLEPDPRNPGGVCFPVSMNGDWMLSVRTIIPSALVPYSVVRPFLIDCIGKDNYPFRDNLDQKTNEAGRNRIKV